MWHLHDTAVFEDVIISFSQQYAQFLLIGSGYGGRLKKESWHPSTQPQPPALFFLKCSKDTWTAEGLSQCLQHYREASKRHRRMFPVSVRVIWDILQGKLISALWSHSFSHYTIGEHWKIHWFVNWKLNSILHHLSAMLCLTLFTHSDMVWTWSSK